MDFNMLTVDIISFIQSFRLENFMGFHSTVLGKMDTRQKFDVDIGSSCSVDIGCWVTNKKAIRFTLSMNC